MVDTRTHLFANGATARLAVAIADTDTEIQVRPGQGENFPFPNVDEIFKITVEDVLAGTSEIMTVTEVDGDTFTVERAAESTEALNFSADANTIVSHRITAETLEWLASVGGSGGGGGVKTARARVRSDGTFEFGAHIDSIVHLGTGEYAINFEPDYFTFPPVVNATVENFDFSGGKVARSIDVKKGSADIGSVVVNVYTPEVGGDTEAVDSDFNLVAVEGGVNAATQQQVTYIEGSEDRFTPTVSTALSFTLDNSLVNPDDFPNAIILLTLAMDGMNLGAGASFPDSIAVDGVPLGPLDFGAIFASSNTATGQGSALMLAFLRIPDGGFETGLVEISWSTVNVGAVMKATANTFFHVSTTSDGFGLGFLQSRDVEGSNSANIPVFGLAFAASIQDNLGDVDANVYVDERLPETLLTMQTPQQLLSTKYFMTGYTSEPFSGSPVTTFLSESVDILYDPAVIVLLDGAVEVE